MKDKIVFKSVFSFVVPMADAEQIYNLKEIVFFRKVEIVGLKKAKIDYKEVLGTEVKITLRNILHSTDKRNIDNRISNNHYELGELIPFLKTTSIYIEEKHSIELPDSTFLSSFLLK